VGIRGKWVRTLRSVALLVLLFCPAIVYSATARAEDPPTLSSLEAAARADFIAGLYGPADEKIRAAIALATNDDFNRLALLQGLIATRMGSDGRSLLGAATGAHESHEWPRPIIAYLLGEQKLQEVADGERHSGNNAEIQRQHICELSFYAGAFAAADGQAKFARALFEKATKTCNRDDPIQAMTKAEMALMATQQ